MTRLTAEERARRKAKRAERAERKTKKAWAEDDQAGIRFNVEQLAIQLPSAKTPSPTKVMGSRNPLLSLSTSSSPAPTPVNTPYLPVDPWA